MTQSYSAAGVGAVGSLLSVVTIGCSFVFVVVAAAAAAAEFVVVVAGLVDRECIGSGGLAVYAFSAVVGFGVEK